MQKPEPKFVTVRQGNKVIYEGPDNRAAFDKRGFPFGLTTEGIIQIVVWIVAATTFYVKTNERLAQHDRDITYLTGFAQASDEWHSTATGTRFHGGAPVDGGFDSRRLRNNLDRKHDDN